MLARMLTKVDQKEKRNTVTLIWDFEAGTSLFSLDGALQVVTKTELQLRARGQDQSRVLGLAALHRLQPGQR